MTQEERLKYLKAARLAMIEYLRIKMIDEDWHGVQDAASDLRDIDTEIKALASKSNGFENAHLLS